MVINESLRLFPPGCFIGRHTTTDLDLGRLTLIKYKTNYITWTLAIKTVLITRNKSLYLRFFFSFIKICANFAFTELILSVQAYCRCSRGWVTH